MRLVQNLIGQGRLSTFNGGRCGARAWTLWGLLEPSRMLMLCITASLLHARTRACRQFSRHIQCLEPVLRLLNFYTCHDGKLPRHTAAVMLQYMPKLYLVRASHPEMHCIFDDPV